METTHRSLKLLIAIRLLAITSFVVPFVLFLAASDQPSLPIKYFWGIGFATYLLSAVYLLLVWRFPRHSRGQAWLQLFFDALLITSLVYLFGGVSSSFSTFYVVAILAAALILPRRSAIAYANISWGLYALLSILLFTGRLPAALDEPQISSFFGANLALHFVGFNAIAFLASYVSSRQRRTEQTLQQERLHHAALETFHQDVTSSISSGLITTDLEGHILTVNPAAERILGLTSGELLGATLVELGIFTSDEWTDSLDEQPIVHNQRQLSIQGQTLLIGYSLNPIQQPDGRRRGLSLIFQDLSERRRLEEALALKDRMAAVGELSAGLAHEIGNPLAAISGSVQLLRATGSEDDKKLLDIIHGESQRLDRIIKNFLRFAHAGETAFSEFDIAQLLSENSQLLRNSDEVKPHHQVSCAVQPASVQLVGDRDQISQVFWNLVRNSLRAMPDGGTLRITGRLSGGTYRLQVLDTGTGMTREQRSTIFQPFQSKFGGGTGIGMAIVYRIVEEHAGELSIDSEVGRGTCVTLELPLAGAGSVPKRRQEPIGSLV